MSRPRIHLICNAHLDPVWQWRREEGCAEAIATFRTAVELLSEHNELIFNHNEALLYRWVKKYDPELFSAIQLLVNKGRWCISGGWYLQPDVNLPAAESIIRHITIGRRFFMKYFNVQPLVAYNFDSFGHSGGLPQILVQAGYKMYIHMRPSASELELPADLYRWRGVDGSELAAFRISVGLYHTEYDNIEQRLDQGVELARQLNRDVPVFWGIGNHGGGATREDLQKIDAYCQREHRVEIVHSTPDRFYHAVQDLVPSAPVVTGDLQRIFTGCYTSLSRLKRRAQQSLHRLVQAEILRTVTWWAFGAPFPEKAMIAAWHDHLFNDFHDILPGTCIEPAEQDALDLYGRVAETVRRLGLAAAITFNNSTSGDFAIPVTVMNSNPGCTHVPVEVECMISYRPKWQGIWHLRLFKLDGSEIPCQEEQPESLLPFNGWRRKICFMEKLPAVGAANYYLEAVAGNKTDVTPAMALRFNFGGKSGLVEELSANDMPDCLAGPLLLPLVIADEGDSWGTDCWQYRTILGKFEPAAGGIRMIETGSIRTIYETVFTYNHSKIIFKTIAYSRWPVLEFRLQVHWNEEQKRLKLAIPTVLKTEQLLCEVPGGVIARPADGQEHVHGRWFLLTGTINGHEVGLGVVHNGQHGLDFQNGAVRLSVLRSAAYCHEQGFNISESPVRKFMDQGVHEVRLLVTVGAAATILQSLPGLADWIGAPPLAYAHLPIGSFNPNKVESGMVGKPVGFYELFTIEPENVRLLACKPGRNGEYLIIRLQESAGLLTQARLIFKLPQLNITLSFRSMEIKTLRLDRFGNRTVVDLISEDKMTWPGKR